MIRSLKSRALYCAIASLLLLAGVFVCYAWVPGRMTGGGSIFQGELRITHGFELHCAPDESGGAIPGPNNLEINWGGNHFHLDSLIFSVCTTDAGFSPNPPSAGFTTMDAAGWGTYNNTETCRASFRFTDYGEPGTQDLVARLTIDCPVSGTVVSVTTPTPLTFGNHQAHASD